jgi:hypothetical protein
MPNKIILKLINIVTGFCEIIDGISRIISLGFLNINLELKWIVFSSKKLMANRIKNMEK